MPEREDKIQRSLQQQQQQTLKILLIDCTKTVIEIQIQIEWENVVGCFFSLSFFLNNRDTTWWNHSGVLQLSTVFCCTIFSLVERSMQRAPPNRSSNNNACAREAEGCTCVWAHLSLSLSLSSPDPGWGEEEKNTSSGSQVKGRHLYSEEDLFGCLARHCKAPPSSSSLPPYSRDYPS